MVEEVKKLKMKIVDFNKKQMKERIEKIKVETEKRIAEGNVQNRFCDPRNDLVFYRENLKYPQGKFPGYTKVYSL